MAYNSNPFLLRTTDQTPDQDFVRLFSPKIIERLPDDAFQHGVHVFRSPPGGGKSTLLRAFTPGLLKAFWNTRHTQDVNDAYHKLVARQVMSEHDGPQLLGISLSCAAGYADLPPSASIIQDGLFRALLDCRVVLRSLRNLKTLLSYSADHAADIRLEYTDAAADLKSIPTNLSARDLERWAEERERSVYSALDFIGGGAVDSIPSHVRFESVLWLQAVTFVSGGKTVAPRRLLMIDDLHKLRRKQRSFLIEELTELRPTIPVWLAERSIALGESLLSPGAREGRDLRVYSLEEIWSGQQRSQFSNFAQNVLQRRLDAQTQIPSGAFSQYLRDYFLTDEFKPQLRRDAEERFKDTLHKRTNPRYSEWLRKAAELASSADIDGLRELYAIRILIARDEAKRQMTLELNPLLPEELQERDSPQVQAASELFMHEELKIPLYFGIDKLCALATNNVEELLGLAAKLYEGLQAKYILRKPDLLLSPLEQERSIKEVAKRKRDFIPKNHTEGTRAQRLLDAIGAYCRERTFLPSAPYAPGVTGVRLSISELNRLMTLGVKPNVDSTLRRVLSECVAENLLVPRESSSSTSREAGTVYYLNRTLCANFDLPLQTGGWQDVKVETLIEWMETGSQPSKRRQLDIQ